MRRSLEPSFPCCLLGRQGSGSKRSPPPIRIACLQFDEPQDDLAVALAGPAHGPHSVDHGRLDLDEAIGPDRAARATGLRPWAARGDGVIGRISKGDANHLRALDPGRSVVSWRVSVAAECHHRCRIGRLRAAETPSGVCEHLQLNDRFKKSLSMSGEIGSLVGVRIVSHERSRPADLPRGHGPWS
jgi:hypothetical protein